MPDEDGNIDPPWRLDPTINIINLSWGNNAVLAGNLSSGGLISSLDGRKWRDSPNLSGGDSARPAFGDGVWVGFARHGDTDLVLTSKDGAKTWTSQPAPGRIGSDVAYGKPDKKSKTGVFITFGSSGGTIALSVDKGRTWSEVDVVSDDNTVRLEFLCRAGDYFYTGTSTRQLVGDDNLVHGVPHGVLYSSRDGNSWARQDLFTGLDWSITTQDLDGERLDFLMIGVAYDDKSKSYVCFGQMEGDALNIVAATSGDGRSFSGGEQVASGIVNHPDFEATAFDASDGMPSGGNGNFVLPLVKWDVDDDVGSATYGNIIRTYAGVVVGRGGGGWNVSLFTSGGGYGASVGVGGSVYIKRKKRFVAAIGSGGSNGQIFMSDENASNWVPVSSQYPFWFAIGRVSWGSSDNST